MSTIRFIHTADLHLDSPFKGMTGLSTEQIKRLRESTFEAFANLIEHALTIKPDFVLIVGDIYDGENRSLRAQMKFHEGMEKLNYANIPVFILHGNHDHLNGRWTRFEMPGNVHVFGGNVERKELQVNDVAVAIYGFSYKERHIRESMIEQYPVAQGRDFFHIGMLHGSLAGDDTHAVYAPFTKSELISKGYDYWALGHIHLRQNLNEDPPIVYPGNLQGRHRNERGVKGFYEVELSKRASILRFIPTSAIVFEAVEVTCAGIRHANEWIERCKETIEGVTSEHRDVILELQMVDMDRECIELFSQSTEEEWLAVLRDAVEGTEFFIWIQKLTFVRSPHYTVASSALIQSVQKTMDEWSEDEWKDVLKDVYQHVRGVKYLEVLTKDEVDEIKVGATTLLTREMGEVE